MYRTNTGFWAFKGEEVNLIHKAFDTKLPPVQWTLQRVATWINYKIITCYKQLKITESQRRKYGQQLQTGDRDPVNAAWHNLIQCGFNQKPPRALDMEDEFLLTDDSPVPALWLEVDHLPGYFPDEPEYQVKGRSPLRKAHPEEQPMDFGQPLTQPAQQVTMTPVQVKQEDIVPITLPEDFPTYTPRPGVKPAVAASTTLQLATPFEFMTPRGMPPPAVNVPQARVEQNPQAASASQPTKAQLREAEDAATTPDVLIADQDAPTLQSHTMRGRSGVRPYFLPESALGRIGKIHLPVGAHVTTYVTSPIKLRDGRTIPRVLTGTVNRDSVLYMDWESHMAESTDEQGLVTWADHCYQQVRPMQEDPFILDSELRKNESQIHRSNRELDALYEQDPDYYLEDLQHRIATLQQARDDAQKREREARAVQKLAQAQIVNLTLNRYRTRLRDEGAPEGLTEGVLEHPVTTAVQQITEEPPAQGQPPAIAGGLTPMTAGVQVKREPVTEDPEPMEAEKTPASQTDLQETEHQSEPLQSTSTDTADDAPPLPKGKSRKPLPPPMPLVGVRRSRWKQTR